MDKHNLSIQNQDQWFSIYWNVVARPFSTISHMGLGTKLASEFQVAYSHVYIPGVYPSLCTHKYGLDTWTFPHDAHIMHLHSQWSQQKNSKGMVIFGYLQTVTMSAHVFSLCMMKGV